MGRTPRSRPSVLAGALVAAVIATLPACWDPDTTEAGATVPGSKLGPVNDFDFWLGDWKVRWHGLGQDGSYALAGVSTHKVVRALEGRAVIEFADGDEPQTSGHTTRGISIRHFDAGLGEWVMVESWPRPDQTGLGRRSGVFRHGRIELFTPRVGQDGNTYDTRYTFSDVTPSSLRWDNAWSADGGFTWRTETIAEMERLGPAEEWSWPTPLPSAGTRDLCASSESREFDFLLGRWRGSLSRVSGPAHEAELRAYSVVGGCALLERLMWTEATGAREQLTLRLFDTGRGKWLAVSLTDDASASFELRVGTRTGSVVELEALDPGVESYVPLKRTRWEIESADRAAYATFVRDGGGEPWREDATLALERVP